MTRSMPLRYPVSTAIVAVALALTAGVFLFARPVYHAAHQGETIKLNEGPPAADASGAAGWTWASTPGWKPGQMVGKHHEFNASGVQPIEVAAAQLAAAHKLLDASDVRILVAARFDDKGPDAILATPVLDVTPPEQCLGVMLAGTAPVRWQCPNDPRDAISHSHVLVIAVAGLPVQGHTPMSLIGAARGDVHRIVLRAPGTGNEVVYTRGTTWGNFEISRWTGPGTTLFVYGAHGLTQTVDLNVKPGTTRVVG